MLEITQYSQNESPPPYINILSREGLHFQIKWANLHLFPALQSMAQKLRLSAVPTHFDFETVFIITSLSEHISKKDDTEPLYDIAIITKLTDERIYKKVLHSCQTMNSNELIEIIKNILKKV